MSLTSEIRRKDSYIRRFMDIWFPELPSTARTLNRKLKTLPTVCPAAYNDNERYLYMVVGTAIDYRIRAYFDSNIHRTDAIQQGVRMAECVLDMDWPNEDGKRTKLRNPWHQWRGADGVAESLFRAYEGFIESALPFGTRIERRSEERLARFCFIFAILDSIGRSPNAPWFLYRNGSRDTEAMLASVPGPALDDIVNLTSCFYQRHSDTISKTRVFHIGQPPSGSNDVGGADFDLVLDGTLFEFKTSLKSHIRIDFLRQVIGYWLLDYPDEFGISAAAIDLTRQGHTEYFELAADLLKTTNPKAIRRIFQDGCQDGKVQPCIPRLKIPTPASSRSSEDHHGQTDVSNSRTCQDDGIWVVEPGFPFLKRQKRLSAKERAAQRKTQKRDGLKEAN